MAASSPGQKVGFFDLLLSVVMLVLLTFLMAPADASEIYPDLADVGSGQLLTRTESGYQALPILSSRFRVSASGLVAHARLVQQFRNDSAGWIEAVYVFPLPDNSAINAMELRVGERVITGKVKEKQQAQREYVQAMAQGQRAGLVDQQRPNLFSTRVANIGPGETVSVELAWVQTLDYDSGEFSLRLPTTLTPRYIPGTHGANTEIVLSASGWAMPTDQVPDAPAITPPQIQAVPDHSHQAHIEVQVDSGFDLAEFIAPFHPITTHQQGTLYLIEPELGSISMNRDFVLRWKPLQQQMPLAAAFHETVGEHGHSLLMLLPPVDENAVEVLPRELILVIDTSGSMAGASMEQARAALLLGLQQLRATDAFNLIEFNSGYRELFPQAVVADTANIAAAQRFVRGLVSTGGTEMAAPLQTALTGETSGEYVRQVVFITDGSVGNETALFNLIQRHIGNSRLYTVGIGSAPNTYFMRKAAEAGRGTFTLIGSTAEVQEKMAELFARIEKPVITNLTVEFDGGSAEIYPQKIPDLFLGQPLLVHARFLQQPGSATIRGDYQGQPWQTRLQLTAGQRPSQGIATLWAREKVTHLVDEGVRTGQSGQFRDDIIQAGLDYQIVTPHTSFVAVEEQPARTGNEALASKQIPNLMPQGSAQAAPAVGYPQTALGIQRHLLLGLLALMAALAVWHRAEFRAETLEC